MIVPWFLGWENFWLEVLEHIHGLYLQKSNVIRDRLLQCHAGMIFQMVMLVVSMSTLALMNHFTPS